MRIAVVSSGSIPSKWAHSINVMKHADAFQKLGNNVDVLTVKSGDMENGVEVHEWYGVDHRIGIHQFKKRIPNFLQRNIFQRKIKSPHRQQSEFCRNTGVDFAYSRSFKAIKLNIENRIPTVLETHTPDLGNHSLLNALKWHNSDYFLGVVTISDYLKTQFLQAGVPEDKILVIPDAVDYEEYATIRKTFSQVDIRNKLGLPTDRPLAIYSGHLYEGRGVEFILEAAMDTPEVDFYFVGGWDEDVRKYGQMAEQLNCVNVHFTGFVKNSLVPYYNIAADVLLMPYTRDTPTWRQMSPIKMFEYLASGNPIVATRLPAIEDILSPGENALLIREKDAAQLKKAITMILTSTDLRQKIYQNNINYAPQFSYKNRVSKILQIYYQWIQKRSIVPS